MIRVVLPAHLRTLARLGPGDVLLEVDGEVTPNAILTALEAKYPMLRGTIRDYGTLARRPYIRFFACGEDVSRETLCYKLPDAVARGEEPFLIVGAVAGG